MKNTISCFILLVALGVAGVASAGTALQGAQDYAARQRDEALAALAAAKARLDAATKDVNRGEEALTKARLGRNVVAEGVAKEAIKSAAARVGQAGVPVQQATLALNGKNAVLLRLQAMQGRPAPRALALPTGAVQRFAADGSAVADPLAPLRAGDRVETGTDGSAQLFLAGGSATGTLEAGSVFRLVSDVPAADFLAVLDRGSLRLAVHGEGGSERFEVRTPLAACAAQSAGFSLALLPDGLRVSVHEGVVTVTPAAGGNAVQVHAGEQRDYLAGKGFGPVQALPAAAGGSSNASP
jgi:ferric-dicitrate binding protein FerR (iron transport regulator)